MRVLFLASRDWLDPKACGGDLCTTDYARALARQGHDVTLICARYKGSAREDVSDGVRIVRPGGIFLLALWAPLFYLRHRTEFDVVYEEGMASVRLPYCAPLYIRKPIMAMWYQLNETIFDEQYPRPVAGALTIAERLLLTLHRRARLLTLTQGRKAEIVSTGFPEDRIDIVPPLMLDSRPRQVARVEREQLIVWLGKIRRYKCPHHAIDALARVVKTVPEAKLVIAGRRDDEGYKAELLLQARESGLADRVDIRLNISEEEKWTLLARAKALVVTSPVEGFGIVIVEANSCGAPAVVTDGVPEATARDGYNAIRVPFGDSAAMASALVRLLRDARVFETYSNNARRHAETFTPAATELRLEQLLADTSARAA